ncbi:DUF5987 family protein [Streptomyces sp. NPDC099088]|uniref:DUF5987 family protein n=1 Tax=Streptomyces sp. NPDC099088 TaxID=3366101 RepID=UPI003819A149
MEAYADTLIPGERRYPGDRPIAGAVDGPGAVQAGALQVLTLPQLSLAPLLPDIAALLNARAFAFAASHLILLPPSLPAIVGMSFTHRTAFVRGLFGTDEPDRLIWQLLSLLIYLSFDTAAHQDTVQAMETHHPGLVWLGFPPPDPDGLWRYVDYSYGTALAALHPTTTDSGSPA